MSLIRIENSNLVRDTSNMAVINTDSNELQEYMNKRKMLLEQRNEINTMKESISMLKDDIYEIKNLLKQLLNNRE